MDEAYRSQDLRAAIRAGLLLTLQVDDRYGGIAYAMADGVLHNGEEALTEAATGEVEPFDSLRSLRGSLRSRNGPSGCEEAGGLPAAEAPRHVVPWRG